MGLEIRKGFFKGKKEALKILKQCEQHYDKVVVPLLKAAGAI